MAGMYFYIWPKPILDNPGLIGRYLDDIAGYFGCKWLVVDTEPSLLAGYEGRYMAALEHLMRCCAERGLTIMPIVNFGSGLLTEAWYQEHPDAAARVPATGEMARWDDDSHVTMSYYSQTALERLVQHTSMVLKLIEPVQYRVGGDPVVEIMEDVGYPKRGHADAHRLTEGDRADRVTEFVSRLTDHARDFGYRCVVKTFRDAQAFHHKVGTMGLNFHGLAGVVDGFIEGVCPWWNDHFVPDYGPVERGIDFQSQLCRGKLFYVAVLCERRFFDIRRHVEIALARKPTDIVFYEYNEEITSDVGLQTYQPHREMVRALIREYGL